ncbi:hypothetical protein DIE22_25605 [Burkholderia sp. Bp9142]|nr:hypothetical protein DIE22_25605 [Burkholderia sp. Bp9142]RQR54623.1 hypothetical protein DIE21_07230 [Burkholderia sp. Bp9140]
MERLSLLRPDVDDMWFDSLNPIRLASVTRRARAQADPDGRVARHSYIRFDICPAVGVREHPHRLAGEVPDNFPTPA